IGAAFLPGIKHGFMHGICHSPPPKKQVIPGCIAAHSRDAQVGAHADYDRPCKSDHDDRLTQCLVSSRFCSTLFEEVGRGYL
ncbi:MULTISPECIES: hypothetical protein, partial [unclassified Bradyrhizobium]|uniref:hypothetical protein n=1 Tax=unclassified Bradyrhizobium TaxID=2631580 RepID=UPI001AED4BC6